MNPNDIVSVMAAILSASYPPATKSDEQLATDRTAIRAWDLYNAVQFTSSEAAERSAARYSQGR